MASDRESVVRVAVVGVGHWGWNLVRNFAALGALRSVVDLDPDRAARVREEYPDVVASSMAEALSDPEVTGVVIATPASTHSDLARVALEADKDVFVEKPLALLVEEGTYLVEEAARRGRVLMVGHLLRYHPAIAKLKGLINEGLLGKLYYVYSNRLNLGRYRTEENILWSFAPHDISAILYLLDELPAAVSAHAGTYLSHGIPDTTVTSMEFRSGVKAHIFVSWLHPYKEQRLVVVGERAMATFDDVRPDNKLVVMRHEVEWRDRHPVPHKDEAEVVPLPEEEPLRAECRHFLECIHTRSQPFTDGSEGVRVLEVLQACEQSLNAHGSAIVLGSRASATFFVHPTAVVDQPSRIGKGTLIWHFSHLMADSEIGRDCIIGQNVFIGSGVVIGDNVKIQNNVSVYTGVVLERDVFCGPSVVFTNVINPRAHVSRRHEHERTIVRQGATLGANCTIICGNAIGRYAFVAAGSVVTKDVPDYALVKGSPARLSGWMCQCGTTLTFQHDEPLDVEHASCESCGSRYVKRHETVTPSELQESARLTSRSSN